MSNWIKNGLTVVHVSNLDVPMSVDHPVYQVKKIKGENNEEVPVSRLIGIKVKIVNSDGTVRYDRFHSKELIPLSVAVKGKLEAYRFINREGEYKDY